MSAPKQDDRPPWTSRPGLTAALSVAAAAAVTALFLHSLAAALVAQPAADFLAALASSAWAQATAADYAAGALLLAAWVALRRGPPVAGVPHAAWALALPPLGNPVAYAYLSLAVLRTRDVGAALVPLGSRAEHDDGEATPSVRRRRRAGAAAIALLAAVYFCFLLRAFVAEDVMAGYHALREEPLVYATFLDSLMGIAAAAAIIGVREGATLTAAAWIAALAMFGHGVACLYALSVCRDAEEWDVSLGTAWATSSPNCPRRSALLL
jgi:hypothetical protein